MGKSKTDTVQGKALKHQRILVSHVAHTYMTCMDSGILQFRIIYVLPVQFLITHALTECEQQYVYWLRLCSYHGHLP